MLPEEALRDAVIIKCATGLVSLDKSFKTGWLASNMEEDIIREEVPKTRLAAHALETIVMIRNRN